MSVFKLYLDLGVHHILDFRGFDHILFLISLCAVYKLNEWKRLLLLVTAFTLGHTLTLLLATLKILVISTELVEFLIPLTILINSLFNIFYKEEKSKNRLHKLKYFAALFFGLIHGLGFSNYLRSLLGKEPSIIKPLLAFNIGIEAGQVFIVSFIMLASYLFINRLKVSRRIWILVISIAAAGISSLLLIERIPF